MFETRCILREAIRHQRPVVGLGNGLRREFCPHILGHTDGVWRTLVWQFAGLSESGLPEGGDWRCFALEDLRELNIRNGPWRRGVIVSADQLAEHIAVVDLQVDPAFGPELRGGFMSRFRFAGMGARAAR